MIVLEVKTGVVLYDPNKVRMGVTAEEIISAYEESDMIKELISKECWFGTIQRPMDAFKMETFLSIDPSMVAFRIKKIWRIKGKVFGDIEIVNSTAGYHLQKMWSLMVFVPRALGHKEKNKCLLVTFDARPDISRAETEESIDGLQE